MNAGLFIQSDGAGGSAGWTKLGNVMNVTLTMPKGESDATVRANNGYRATVPTLKDATLEFEMVWDDQDENLDTIRSAYFGDTILGVRVLDEDTSGGEGLQADMMITEFSIDQSLEEVIKLSVSMKITFSNTAPTWINSS